MKPVLGTVGRTVHYMSYGTPNGEYKPECRAAIITAVPDVPAGRVTDTVHLCVLNPEGFFFNKYVHYSDDHEGGTWHWPERASAE